LLKQNNLCVFCGEVFDNTLSQKRRYNGKFI